MLELTIYFQQEFVSCSSVNFFWHQEILHFAPTRKPVFFRLEWKDLPVLRKFP